MPGDLDRRLRDALGRPVRAPEAGTAFDSILTRLPRFRARRRAARLAIASTAVVLAAGLGTGLALSFATTPLVKGGTTAAPPVGPNCVAVQVTGRPAACINEQPPAGYDAGREVAAAAAPPEMTTAIRATVGSSIRVLLPRLPGRPWTSVSFVPVGSAGAGRLLPSRSARGGTVEVVAHAAAGQYVIEVTAAARCATACSKVSAGRPSVWSAEVVVVPR